MDHHKAAHAMHKAMDSIAVALDGLREARRQAPTAIADQLGLLSQQAQGLREGLGKVIHGLKARFPNM
jgi:hypothetical protein